MSQPPALAAKALRALLDPRDEEIVTADLREEFDERVERSGSKAASAWYVRQVRGFLLAAPWLRCLFVTIASWQVAFLAGAAISIRRLPSEFAFLPAAAVFVIAIPVAAFTVANRTRKIRVGLAAGVGTCAGMVGLAVLLLNMFHLRHPPFRTLWTPVIAAACVSGVLGLAGKASREGPEFVHWKASTGKAEKS